MRILIADDDENLRNVIGLYFRNREHLVDEAVNGLEAFTLAVIRNYDRVLSDVSMPFIRGDMMVDILTHAKPYYEGRVLLMTGGEYPRGYDCVMKPFKLSVLYDRLISMKVKE